MYKYLFSTTVKGTPHVFPYLTVTLRDFKQVKGQKSELLKADEIDYLTQIHQLSNWKVVLTP
jgi:hypothetical protein